MTIIQVPRTNKLPQYDQDGGGMGKSDISQTKPKYRSRSGSLKLQDSSVKAKKSYSRNSKSDNSNSRNSK